MVVFVPAVYSSAVCVPSGMLVLTVTVAWFCVIDRVNGARNRRLMLAPRLVLDPGLVVVEPVVGDVPAGGSAADCSMPGADRATRRKPPAEGVDAPAAARVDAPAARANSLRVANSVAAGPESLVEAWRL